MKNTFIKFIILLFLGIVEIINADIILNEIMANAIDEDTGEFIELYNTGNEPVDVEGWQFTDGDAVDTIRAFEDDDCVIMPESFALILDSEYAGEYNLPPDILLLTTKNTTLGNGFQMNDPITLFDETGNNIIDTYSHPIKTKNGISVEKVDQAKGDIPNNWKPCMAQSGSTPGEANSFASPITEFFNIVITGTERIQINQAAEFTLEVHDIDGNINEDWNDSFIITTEPGVKIFLQDESETDFPLKIQLENGVGTFNLIARNTGKINIQVQSTTDTKLVANKTIEAIKENEILPQNIEIVINEIMYIPDTKAGQTEWVELYNRTDSVIKLTGWTIVDASGNTGIIIADNVIVEPHKYLILTKNLDDLKNQFPDVKNAYEIKLPALNNSGDTIILKGPNDIKIDHVVYEGKSETRGKSLERVTPELSSENLKNWRTSIDLAGATPGKKNSVSWEFSSDKPKLIISPQTFNPSVRKTKISYEVDVNAIVTIKIYDLKGRLVRTLIDEKEVGGAQSINWDGKDNRNMKLSVGAYICQIVAKIDNKIQTSAKTLIIAQILK